MTNWLHGYDFARKVADEFIEIIRPYCEQVQIAGSLRRGKDAVKDIEIVAIPKLVSAMFGEDESGPSQLDHFINERNGVSWTLEKNGKRFKKINPSQYSVKIDLFVVRPPAQWGAILAIRTGPADFSRWLMTAKSKGGAMPPGLKQNDGALWIEDTYNGRLVGIYPTPTEKSYFEALGLEWIRPQERRANWSR